MAARTLFDASNRTPFLPLSTGLSRCTQYGREITDLRLDVTDVKRELPQILNIMWLGLTQPQDRHPHRKPCS